MIPVSRTGNEGCGWTSGYRCSGTVRRGYLGVLREGRVLCRGVAGRQQRATQVAEPGRNTLDHLMQRGRRVAQPLALRDDVLLELVDVADQEVAPGHEGADLLLGLQSLGLVGLATLDPALLDDL